MNLLNMTTQILAYSADISGQTDNPHMRNFDWERRFANIEIRNPKSFQSVVAPGESITLFDGTRSHSMTGSTVLTMALLDASKSIYRLSVTSGPSGFRTARSISGLTTCNVTINNNSVAVFDFAGATLTGVVPGDIMRIKGAATYDAGPYVFGSLNAGLWKIIGINGTAVSCVRFVGEQFIGGNESVTGISGDVQIYSSAGIQVGDKVSIDGSFSIVTQRVYTISAVTPTTIDFVSTISIPNESSVTYIPDSISFYTQAKKIVYVECDQDAVVRFDGETSNKTKINPIQPGSPCLVGYIHKWGSTFKCEVVNISVNPMNVIWITGE
jgi:hypothetical protein